MNGFDLAARDLDLLAGIGVTEQQAADARRTIARHCRDANDFVDLTRALGLAHDPDTSRSTT